VFHGNLPPYLMAKDLILAVIGDIGVDGATYRAMEFDGDGVFALNIEERMTLCNMAIEAGGKNGVIAPDQVTLDFVNNRGRKTGNKPYTVFNADPGAKYIYEKVYDVTKLEPVIAKPHSPDNKAFVSEVKGTKLDRAYIGSCTGGKLTDFRVGHGNGRREVAARHLPGGRGEDRRRQLCGVSRWAERHVRPAEHADLVHQHDEPELPRPDGSQRGESIPGQPADGGRQRPDRGDRRPAEFRGVIGPLC
jgi:hypothetical protein